MRPSAGTDFETRPPARKLSSLARRERAAPAGPILGAMRSRHVRTAPSVAPLVHCQTGPTTLRDRVTPVSSKLRACGIHRASHAGTAIDGIEIDLAANA